MLGVFGCACLCECVFLKNAIQTCRDQSPICLLFTHTKRLSDVYVVLSTVSRCRSRCRIQVTYKLEKQAIHYVTQNQVRCCIAQRVLLSCCFGIIILFIYFFFASSLLFFYFSLFALSLSTTSFVEWMGKRWHSSSTNRLYTYIFVSAE